MPYVITCGDEGVQINVGTRLGVVGAGVKLDGFEEVIKTLREQLGDEIRVAASAENAWIKQQFSLDTWEQADATAQQQTEALADQHNLLYAGFAPFADPKQLKHDIKGHMVRPKKVHIANKIMFTLAGGEQTYNLGCFVISAEWVSQVPLELVKQIIKTQVDHYKSLITGDWDEFIFEKDGDLDRKLVEKNEAVLKKLGFQIVE